MMEFLVIIWFALVISLTGVMFIYHIVDFCQRREERSLAWSVVMLMCVIINIVGLVEVVI